MAIQDRRQYMREYKRRVAREARALRAVMPDLPADLRKRVERMLEDAETETLSTKPHSHDEGTTHVHPGGDLAHSHGPSGEAIFGESAEDDEDSVERESKQQAPGPVSDYPESHLVEPAEVPRLVRKRPSEGGNPGPIRMPSFDDIRLAAGDVAKAGRSSPSTAITQLEDSHSFSFVNPRANEDAIRESAWLPADKKLRDTWRKRGFSLSYLASGERKAAERVRKQLLPEMGAIDVIGVLLKAREFHLSHEGRIKSDEALTNARGVLGQAIFTARDRRVLQELQKQGVSLRDPLRSRKPDPLFGPTGLRLVPTGLRFVRKDWVEDVGGGWPPREDSDGDSEEEPAETP